MCGIIAINSHRDIVPLLIDGLKQLEYRGYDSAGIASINRQQQLSCLRTAGKISQLEQALKQSPIHGHIGIAHTRWATHGDPCERNAHPHLANDSIAIVHNGIIENHEALRATLHQDTHFKSDTDSEVIAHLLHQRYEKHQDLLAAAFAIAKQLQQGSYGLCLMSKAEKNRLVAMRSGSPLIIGLGQHENGVASDMIALLSIADTFIYLEDGDIADIKPDHVTIYDQQGNIVERQIHRPKIKNDRINRGHFRHYMLKEIYEQPDAIEQTLSKVIDPAKNLHADAFGANAQQFFSQTNHIKIIACGTSYHAGLVARYWLENIAGIGCDVEIASEFRYRQQVVTPNTLLLTISQSGETADTLAALKQAQQSKNYLASLAICNVEQSSLARLSDMVFLTHAGVEIGVASTKAFTTQLVALLALSLLFAQQQQRHNELCQKIIDELIQLPDQLTKIIAALDNKNLVKLAEKLSDKKNCLFLGRGIHYPIALEGALKLKEISYIHAEAYAAGELKHGPLALVDEEMPVIAIAPHDYLFGKVTSNLQEVLARGGKLIVLSDEEKNWDEAIKTIYLPHGNEHITPITYTIALQLLAYHVAASKGTDIDQPRNLAKSVTVE